MQISHKNNIKTGIIFLCIVYSPLMISEAQKETPASPADKTTENTLPASTDEVTKNLESEPIDNQHEISKLCHNVADYPDRKKAKKLIRRSIRNHFKNYFKKIHNSSKELFARLYNYKKYINRLTRKGMNHLIVTQLEKISPGHYLIKYDARWHFNYLTADGDHPINWCNDNTGVLSMSNFCYHDFNIQNLFTNIYFNKIHIKELTFHLTVWDCKEGVDWSYGLFDELPFLFPFLPAGLDAHPDTVIEQCNKEIRYIKQAVSRIEKFANDRTEYINKIQNLKTQIEIYTDNIDQNVNTAIDQFSNLNQLCSLRDLTADINKEQNNIQNQLSSFLSEYDISNMHVNQMIELLKTYLSQNTNKSELEFLKNFVERLETVLSSTNQETSTTASQLQTSFVSMIKNSQILFLFHTIDSIILNARNRIETTSKQGEDLTNKIENLITEAIRNIDELESLSLQLSNSVFGENITIMSSKQIRFYKILTDIPAFNIRFRITYSNSKNGPWGYSQ